MIADNAFINFKFWPNQGGIEPSAVPAGQNKCVAYPISLHVHCLQETTQEANHPPCTRLPRLRRKSFANDCKALAKLHCTSRRLAYVAERNLAHVTDACGEGTCRRRSECGARARKDTVRSRAASGISSPVLRPVREVLSLDWDRQGRLTPA